MRRAGCTSQVRQDQSQHRQQSVEDRNRPGLLQGIQSFLGQTNVIEWGKVYYGPGENGGISGIVQYATTRAEDDPRYAAAEFWEPGIPRVQVNLYKDCNGDGIIDKPDCTLDTADTGDLVRWPTSTTIPSAGATRLVRPDAPRCDGKREDIDRNGNGTFDQGDAFQVAHHRQLGRQPAQRLPGRRPLSPMA